MKCQTLVCSLVALICLIGGNAKGEVDLDFGIKAGANFTRLRVDSQYVNPGNRIAFAGGGLVVLNFDETWAIQLEALYSPKGSSDDVEIVDDDGVTTGTEKGVFRLDYFEVPLLVRFSPDGGPIFLIAGPAMAFKTSSKFTLEGHPDEDLDWVKSTDLGITLGMGATARSFFGKTVFDLRYTWGTSDVNEGDGVAVKNGGFQTTIGLVF